MSDEARSAESLVPALLTAITGLPIGLLTATMEYGLAAVACVASTAAELVAVCRTHASSTDGESVDKAEVIVLRGGGATGRRK